MKEGKLDAAELAKADACLKAMAEVLEPVLKQHEGFHIMLALARIAASNIGGQKDPQAALKSFISLVEHQVAYAVDYYSKTPPPSAQKGARP